VRLLVTGGAGFIGSEFVRMTLRDHPDDSVVVLDKLTYAGNEHNLDSVRSDPRFQFVRGDICDPDTVRELAAHVDVIVNFAAESHVDRSLEAPGQFILTDVYGTFVLMDAARERRHERFLQVSTDEVYGEVVGGESVEDDPFRPRSPYGASKAGGELQVQAYRTSYGFPAIVTRGSNTYGPFQYPEKIIPLFITNAIDGLPLPIYGDGGAVRDYLFVEDHARGIDCALRQGAVGIDYNIGAGGETDGVTVADIVLRLLDKPSSLKQFVLDRPGHDRRYALDSTRLRRLGWRPTVTFESGMATTVSWYAEHGDWWRPLKSGEFWEFYQRNYKPVSTGAVPSR
jgi:dTDP-glucose 4,6-dehydratase